MMESQFEIKKEKKQINEEKESLNDKALCLVEFSNACLRKTLSSVNFEMYKGNIVNQKCRRILVASTDHLMYSGTNYDRSMFQVTSSVLKIAVLNKRTQRFKLYDVDYFVLKPILKCDIFADTFLKSKIEQNQSLTLEFGGKTKKRSLVSKLKFQSGENNMTLDESVLQKISEMPSTSLDIKPTVLSTSDDIIPPVNKTALSPAEVYSIIDIIPEDLYSALESEIGKFKDITYETLQAWKKESKFSDIIIHYLETNYHSLSIENTKLLYYIQFLIIFVNVKYTDLRKKDPLPEIPQPYRQGMMKRYLLNRTQSSWFQGVTSNMLNGVTVNMSTQVPPPCVYTSSMKTCLFMLKAGKICKAKVNIKFDYTTTNVRSMICLSTISQR
ncbi:DNA-directed RNA polymerase I subunit RPA49 isoform X2 [Parasteatoda tepidariorum]|uniref:DNA-directed RNA polymerase I subunit RPA49 isoform X2 n=1 Tax=Parasteatoda tepidariorum TaxID=114398 RepID=UPI0039BCF058